MKHPSLLLVLLLATSGNSLMAQEVSVDVAESRALDFLTNNTPAAKRAKGNNTPLSLSLAYTSRSESKTCFYVFNVGEDDGFVITGGDEAAREILGYCDHGSFDYDTAPENFKWWLGEYANQIAHAEATTDLQSRKQAAERRAKAAKQRESIGPLIKTKWDQRYPYNSEIPVYSSDGQPYVTGCVATAMAQVMNYWKHPQQGQGNYSYTVDEHTFSVDFGATTYDWNHMLNNYDDNDFSDVEAKAVGTLMYHAGVAVDMQYGTSQSGAYNESVGYALVNYFKYDPSLRYESRIYYSDEDWEELVYSELAAGRPIIYKGEFYVTAHEFICDGYDSKMEMFTINWGWSGVCDGCYPLTGVGALYPDIASIYGGWDVPYTVAQVILTQVQPEHGGTERIHLGQAHHVDNVMYLKINNETYDDHYDYDHTSGDLNCYLYTTLWNHCWSNTTSFDLGVKLTEVATGASYYWTSVNHIMLEKNRRYNPYPLGFNPHDLTYNGLYEVRPVCRNANNPDDEWIDIDIWESEPIITISVTGASDPNPGDIPFSIEGNTVQACRTLQIKHSPYYTGAITYTSSNENIATVDENGLVTGVAPGEVTITAEGEAQGNFRKTTAVFDISVTELQKGDVTFSIREDIVFIDKTLKIKWSPVNYDGELIFTSSDPSIATVDENGVIIGQDRGRVTITASVPESALWNPTTTSFDIEVLKNVVNFYFFSRVLYVGETMQITWTEGYDGTPEFSSDNEEVATVDSNGLVTAIAPGTAYITPIAPETRHYYQSQVLKVEITVNENVEFVFTEQPYFNNDNNIFEGDNYLHYQVKNVSDHAGHAPICITLVENGYFKLSTATALIQPNQEKSGQISFSTILSRFTENTPSTVYLYQNSMLWNYPSVTFTLRSSLTVDYSVGSTGYGTLILPFNQELPEGMKVYGCSGVDDNGVLTLVEESSIRRNVPYIVKAAPESAYQFVGPKAIDADKPSFTNDVLVGAVTESVPLVAGTDYILQEQNGRASFFKYTGTPSADPSENDSYGNRLATPFRAFLRLNGANKAKLYLPGQIGDEGEGIEVIGNDNARPAGIYSIDGKRLAKLQKGLNVIVFDDGKTQKVNVK